MIAANFRGKRLSGFYPNCAANENPFTFRKSDYYTFNNIGELHQFVANCARQMEIKSYSKRAYEILRNLKYEDLA